jgi:hypothetical protein
MNDEKLPWSSLQNVTDEKMFLKVLQKRLEKKYTYQLFKMVPLNLRASLKKVLLMTYD